ncbi:Serine acetyltransferase [invertebrate metagenome]|uniref:Serine acetyltransferase n=1 Tax=invertebrate metagenome TaxID=1711999 RepID=A0A484HBU2_9ZZZZ
MAFQRLMEDIDSIIARDPAARSRLEVACCYPGFHALLLYRLAHLLWQWHFRLLARIISHLAKIFTGVEIHPGAVLGKRLFIDHATGVVIGETAKVGNDVTLYQGVTLGGTHLHKGKRHPTIQDGVIVGAGAQVLGPLTVGTGARIGANAVVITDVAQGATMVGIPAKIVMRNSNESNEVFCAYGTPEGLADPVARTITGLRLQMSQLLDRVDELEQRLEKTEEELTHSKDCFPKIMPDKRDFS